jgi:peptide/nickel transport system permease protein
MAAEQITHEQPADLESGPVLRKETQLGALLRRFVRNKLALVGALIIAFDVACALAAPLLAPYDPLDQRLDQLLQRESAAHLMGTDELGRDELSRVIYGARISLQAAIYAVGLAALIGIPIGMLVGYYRGFWDEWIVMRIVDALQAFPFLILALALAAMLGAGFGNAMIAIGVGFAPAFIRIARAQTLAIAHQDYVLAARALGIYDRRILTQHIFPNALAPLLVQTTLAMAGAILAEAGLSFLGLGVQPPTPSWGQMLSAAQGFISLAPWLSYWPGLAIFVTVLGFNLFGDGLRDALDPRLRS